MKVKITEPCRVNMESAKVDKIVEVTKKDAITLVNAKRAVYVDEDDAPKEDKLTTGNTGSTIKGK